MSTTRTYLAQFLVLSLALTVALGANYLYAAWGGPLSSPPPNCISGNPGCDPPINTSATAQTKAGDLTSAGLQADVLSVLGATTLSGKLGIGNIPVYQLDLTDTSDAYPANREGVRFPDGTVQTTAAVGGGSDLSVVDAGFLLRDNSAQTYTFSVEWSVIFIEGEFGNDPDNGSVGGYVYRVSGVPWFVGHEKGTFKKFEIISTYTCVTSSGICFKLDGTGDVVLKLGSGNKVSVSWIAI